MLQYHLERKLCMWQTKLKQKKEAVDLYDIHSIWAKDVRKTQTCQLDGKLTVLLKAVQ